MMMMMLPMMMPLAIGDRSDDRFFHAPPPRSFMHSPEKERKERERERERESVSSSSSSSSSSTTIGRRRTLIIKRERNDKDFDEKCVHTTTRERTSLFRPVLLHYLNIIPYTSLLGVLYSLRYHIEHSLFSG